MRAAPSTPGRRGRLPRRASRCRSAPTCRRRRRRRRGENRVLAHARVHARSWTASRPSRQLDAWFADHFGFRLVRSCAGTAQPLLRPRHLAVSDGRQGQERLAVLRRGWRRCEDYTDRTADATTRSCNWRETIFRARDWLRAPRHRLRLHDRPGQDRDLSRVFSTTRSQRVAACSADQVPQRHRRHRRRDRCPSRDASAARRTNGSTTSPTPTGTARRLPRVPGDHQRDPGAGARRAAALGAIDFEAATREVPGRTSPA